MKNAMVLDICKASVMALAMTFAVSCTKSGQSSAAAGAGPAGPTGSATGPAGSSGPISNTGKAPGGQIDGTTDGAGGNGINGKAYEGYIVDPMNLKSVQEIVGPKLKLLDDASMRMITQALVGYKNADGPEMKEFYEDLYITLFKLKKWYLAPISLKSLEKETIGVSFSKENTEQLAIQTKNEIWIDSNIFDAMPVLEQSRLIIHEYLMSLYLSNFEDANTMCQKFNAARSPKKSYECKMSENKKALRSGKLDENDYSRIRAATDLFMSLKAPGDVIRVAKQMKSLGFGDIFKDLSSEKLYSFDNRPIKAFQLASAIKSAVLSKALDGNCMGLTSSIQKNCKVEITTKQTSDKSIVLSLTLKDSSNNSVIRSLEFMVTDSVLGGLAEDTVKQITFVQAGLNYDEKEGTVFDHVKLTLEPTSFNDGSYKVIALEFAKGVVSSNSEYNGCRQYARDIIVGKNFDDEAILVGNFFTVTSYNDNLSSASTYLGSIGNSCTPEKGK